MKFKKVKNLLFILLLVFLCFVFILELRSNKVETIINRISMQIEVKKGWDKFSLVFKVNFLDIIPGARMYLNCSGLTQYEGNAVYPLELKAEAIPPVSIIKKASAEIFSYVDSAELVPHSFKTRTNMDGDVKEENEIVYNQKEGFMLSKGDKYIILPQTRDVLSLIYYLMKQGFVLNKLWDLNLNSNQSNYEVKTKVAGKITYRVGSKNYSVWELDISARRRRGDNRNSLDAKIFFLETPASNIPILIKASTKMGNVLMRLEEIR